LVLLTCTLGEYTLLEKRVLYGICSIEFFTPLQRIFNAKNGSIMRRKNPFGTKAIIRSYITLFCNIL